MKANKILLILQTIGMYLMQSPLYVVMALSYANAPKETLDAWVGPMMVTSLVLAVLLIPLCMANAVVSFVSVFAGRYSPTKVSMVVKLILIPWYVLNFLFAIILLSGFLNPFLVVAIPLVAVLLIGLTYFYMISTSFPDMAYLFYALPRGLIRSLPMAIVGFVFLFIFSLDVVGAILFHTAVKEAEPSPEEEVIEVEIVDPE